MNELLHPSNSSATMLVTNVLNRTSISLDGEWAYLCDPYDASYISILGTKNPAGVFRDFKARHEGDRVEYDWDRCPTLDVPGDWNTQSDALLYYEGTIWYRRQIEVEATSALLDETKRTLLYFGAANHTARVYVNGNERAVHVGGFGPFAVELTGALHAGTNSLVVQVNNRREPERIPAMQTDWWNFGGLTRSVKLVLVPRQFLSDAWITMGPDGSLVGGVTLDAGDAASNQARQLTVSIDGTPIRLTVDDLEPGSETTFTVPAETAAVLERWNPGAPVFYTVTWTLTSNGSVVDAVSDEVGFRTVATKGSTILVNGTPTFFRGISIHGEGPSGGRRAHGPEDATVLLDWAQDLGVNFVRLAHYQHDEYMVRECDRRGIMCWAELPVYWGIAFGSAPVSANAAAQAAELVRRDRNRACVVFWSIANETLPGPERNQFLADLAAVVRSDDPTRLVAAALLTLPPDGLDVHSEDPLGSIVDVVAINQYLGWYYGDRDDIAATTFTTESGKPIIFSELGAGAKYGHHGSASEIWTEEFQAAVYEQQIAMVQRQTQCAGLSPWILKDFRTPLRHLVGIQDGYNRKGLVSEEGERKLAFEVLAAFYRDLAASA